MTSLERKAPARMEPPAPTGPIPTPPAISLRDWFAGMAMQAVVPLFRIHDASALPTAATVAYRIADAMLKAREDKP